MSTRSNRSGLVGGVLLIVLGVLAMIFQFFDLSGTFWEFSWPFIIVGVGALLFLGMLLGGRGSAGLAVPGSIVTTVGLILLFQNTFGYWESWSYAWTLIVTAVGAGLWLRGAYGGVPESRQAGGRVFVIGLIMFVVFGAFFGLGFGPLGFERSAGLIWPAVLIVLGLYLILARGLNIFRR